MPTIVLIGSSGILSKAIQTKLRKNKLPFSLINICRENHLSNKDSLYKILNSSLKRRDSFIFINCLAALKPKDKFDSYVNTNLPKDLLNYLDQNSFLIHFSTNNIFNKNLKDKYSIQKEIAEDYLKKDSQSNYLIIRLPLLLPIEDIKNRKIPKQYKPLMRLINFPFVSIIPPSRNLYKPINIEKVADLTLTKIRAIKNKSINKKFLTLNGKIEMNLKEISKTLLKNNGGIKKRIIIEFPFPWKFLDLFLLLFPKIKKRFEQSILLQQFLPIKR